MEDRLIDSINTYIEEIKSILKKWKYEDSRELELWYRGIKSKSYKLLPGLYRDRNDGKKIESEFSMFSFFKSRALPFLNSELSYWDWYLLAQHYRLPTRLLDWSLNPLVALYFAVIDEPEDPAVWLLDPDKITVYTTPTEHTNDGIFEYFPNVRGAAKDVIGIFPDHFNTRITVQEGVFTLHGLDKTPIEDIDGVNCQKLEIDPSKINDILEDLNLSGYCSHKLFPDNLEMLASRSIEKYLVI